MPVVSLPGSDYVVMRTRSQYDPTMVELSRSKTSDVKYFYDSRPAHVKPRRKPSGWLYPTSYQRQIIKFLGQHECYAHSIRNYGTWTQHTEYFGSLGRRSDPNYGRMPNLADANQLRAAEIQALLKLKNTRVNLGVALGEMQHTANFLGSTATTIARGVQQLRRGQVRKAFRTIGADWRSWPQNWLGYQYAMRPLLNDVYGSAEALSNRDLPSWVTTVKGVNEVKTSWTETSGSGNTHSTIDVSDRKGVFVRLDFHPSNEFYHTLSSLGVTNPLVVAWELVPFSFVLDWGIQIGSWLETLDATLGFRFLSGSKTFRSERIREANGSIGPRKVGEPVFVTVDHHSKTRLLHVKREVYGGVPRPWLPRVKNPISLQHMANGLSLLAAAMAGGVPKFVSR